MSRMVRVRSNPAEQNMAVLRFRNFITASKSDSDGEKCPEPYAHYSKKKACRQPSCREMSFFECEMQEFELDKVWRNSTWFSRLALTGFQKQPIINSYIILHGTGLFRSRIRGADQHILNIVSPQKGAVTGADKWQSL